MTLGNQNQWKQKKANGHAELVSASHQTMKTPFETLKQVQGDGKRL
tara:strand:+ start:1877 stop:2014 length:138 start_codon:yes stop_codon:yes gene_type:complete